LFYFITLQFTDSRILDTRCMATYKTKAIILSSYPYKEHDRIISFFSENYGRMEARARGTRKIESKLAGHLEPFIETELLLAHGKHWDILAGSRTLEPAQILRSQLELSSLAALCSEAVKLITRFNAPDARIFRILKNTFSLLEDERLTLAHKRSLGISFLWQMLAIAGFTPELTRCIHCRNAAENGAFSFEGGGILCPNCANHDLFAISLSSGLVAELRTKSLSDSREVRQVVIGFWRQVVDYAELRSWKFLEVIS